MVGWPKSIAGGLTRPNPLDDSPLCALGVLYLEARGFNRWARLPEQVISGEPDTKRVEEALDGADRHPVASHMLEQQEPASWAQHSHSFRKRLSIIGNRA